MRSITVVVFSVLITWLAPASAKVITVAKDESGDVAVIQSAISMSAPGDTIRIRPGIYTEHEPYTYSFGVWDAYVAVRVDSLTIIGAGADSVIIGPATANIDGYEPKGIGMAEEGHVTIEGLAVRNVREGIRLSGSANVSDVDVSGCEIGIFAARASGLSVTHSTFRNIRFIGLYTLLASRDVFVAHCAFDSIELALDFSGSTGVLVQDCDITNTECAIQAEGVSSVRAQDVRVVDASTCSISVTYAAEVVVEDSILSDGEYPVAVTGGSLTISNTLIGRGSLYTFLLSNTAEFSVTGCDISIDTLNPKAVNLTNGSYGTSPPELLDMRNNYWGTTDSTTIANSIWDIHDDPAVLGEVLFVPFGDTSVPVQAQTLGQFKTRY